MPQAWEDRKYETKLFLHNQDKKYASDMKQFRFDAREARKDKKPDSESNLNQPSFSKIYEVKATYESFEDIRKAEEKEVWLKAAATKKEYSTGFEETLREIFIASARAEEGEARASIIDFLKTISITANGSPVQEAYSRLPPTVKALLTPTPEFKDVALEVDTILKAQALEEKATKISKKSSSKSKSKARKNQDKRNQATLAALANPDPSFKAYNLESWLHGEQKTTQIERSEGHTGDLGVKVGSEVSASDKKKPKRPPSPSAPSAVLNVPKVTPGEQGWLGLVKEDMARVDREAEGYLRCVYMMRREQRPPEGRGCGQVTFPTPSLELIGPCTLQIEAKLNGQDFSPLGVAVMAFSPSILPWGVSPIRLDKAACNRKLTIGVQGLIEDRKTYVRFEYPVVDYQGEEETSPLDVECESVTLTDNSKGFVTCMTPALSARWGGVLVSIYQQGTLRPTRPTFAPLLIYSPPEPSTLTLSDLSGPVTGGNEIVISNIGSACLWESPKGIKNPLRVKTVVFIDGKAVEKEAECEWRVSPDPSDIKHISKGKRRGSKSAVKQRPVIRTATTSQRPTSRGGLGKGRKSKKSRKDDDGKEPGEECGPLDLGRKMAAISEACGRSGERLVEGEITFICPSFAAEAPKGGMEMEVQLALDGQNFVPVQCPYKFDKRKS
ncbi:hypothetical protein AAMO2058_000091600 [Amorphochlora amoebiformis]